MQDPFAKKPGLIVEVISNPEIILEHEVARVRWYLNHYDRYESLGYSLRLPASIDSEIQKSVTDEEVRFAIQNEFENDRVDYEAYARELQETWKAMFAKILPVMREVYGFLPSGHFQLVPTAYGTGGGSLEKGGAVFFKLPKYRSVNRRTETEAITHEILNHEATAKLREGTAIDDSIFTTHQWYKERLMDLLGRTLIVRAGLMERRDVVMDDYAEAQASKDVDFLYYNDLNAPNESDLRYEGRLSDLIRAVEAKCSTVSDSESQTQKVT